ncbi:hypothetical protein [Granulicella sp. WH15]|uniref:anti-sigma factor family protein n=1 Tax=Granulicella sp. WH15 TaxID=2602070 RepID=UPI001C70094D|nr:hypothetical protein [Granulicella sp. WH15]
MIPEPVHLTDEELLLLADGEIDRAAEKSFREHLELCAECETRMRELQAAIDDVIALHHTELDAQLSSSTGPRAQLKAQLEAQDANKAPFFLRRLVPGYGVSLLAALLIGIMAAPVLKHYVQPGNLQASSRVTLPIPNKQLTPGATRPVKLAEICPAASDDLDPSVPASKRRIVFQEYGMTTAAEGKYQVDYLINPQLGGTDDIRNLWPEPYDATVWNAHAKDALEDRLHQMVCSGQLDLASAQDQIASDWISAYKRYFRTPQPV